MSLDNDLLDKEGILTDKNYNICCGFVHDTQLIAHLLLHHLFINCSFQTDFKHLNRETEINGHCSSTTTRDETL